jgi:hypothetical protein
MYVLRVISKYQSENLILVQDMVDHETLSPIARVAVESSPPATTSPKFDDRVSIVEPASETTRGRFRTFAIMVGLCVRIPTARRRWNLI